ncbi:hypothetical protein [Brevundimonas nasdae]|uniref:Uncharacterized protein n=1 Tax=Brevundimonas nasdae TaxID=172043 RepID=A0ABX8TL42_9CAUL|nr:hypothetical protein [Brevundimonas nasdae]QYC11547.1 hypothetical protein KWG56_06125 [Brevundimonas nasdae]QYC14335.1 hypothetical protein KWG63_01460 [Brevundimonas nasdae]
MIRFAAVSAVALLTLAACDRGEKPGEAVSSGAASAPATAPAVGTALTADGLGAVRIGMTAAEVATVWGANAVVSEPMTCQVYHLDKAPDGVDVMLQDGRLTRITLGQGSSVKTDRGFGVGDSGIAIKQAYGGAVFAQPAKYDPAPAEDLFAWARGRSTAYVVDPAARGIRYEVGKDGLVSRVHAGDPSIQLVENCG